MQKVYKKLLTHPLFISDYVVYFTRALSRTFIGLAPVYYTFIWFYQIKSVKSFVILHNSYHFVTRIIFYLGSWCRKRTSNAEL